MDFNWTKYTHTCLVGIIPGPCEPELTVNQYINPLVDELKQFWSGQELEVRCSSVVHRKLVRCAVLCCSCDLPAGRKLCGFLGHSAHLGCSKCKTFFLLQVMDLITQVFNEITGLCGQMNLIVGMLLNWQAVEQRQSYARKNLN